MYTLPGQWKFQGPPSKLPATARAAPSRPYVQMARSSPGVTRALGATAPWSRGKSWSGIVIDPGFFFRGKSWKIIWEYIYIFYIFIYIYIYHNIILKSLSEQRPQEQELLFIGVEATYLRP
jgi:hypothetical protein